MNSLSLQLLVFLVVAAVVRGSFFGTSGGWNVKNFPNPMKDPLKCGRKDVPRSQVCDPDHILSKTAQDEIEGHINFIKSGQAAVALVKKMDLSQSSADIDKAAEQFCRSLHDTWGVGSAEKNDGVVIFLSIEDRVVYISTGDGAKDRITPGAIDGIIHRMKPFLRNSDYGGALINAIIEVELGLSGQKISSVSAKTAKISGDGEPPTWIKVLFFFVIVAGVGGYSYYQDRKMKRLERGRIALDSLIREVDNSTTNDANGNDKVFITTSCPICLENFPEPLTDEKNGGNGMEEGSAVRENNSSSGGEDLLRNLGPSPDSPVFSAKTPAAKPNKPMALRCGHTFCHECITTYLKTDAGKRCPICRFPVHADYDGMEPLQPPPRPGQPPRPGHHAPDDDGTSCHRGAGASAATAAGGAGLESVDTSDPSRVNQDPMHSDTRGGFYTSSSSSSTYGSQQSGFGARGPEIVYRLNRMRYLYPDVMTAQLLHNMNRAVDRGSLQDMRSELSARSVEVQRTVTEMREASQRAARSSGSRGSSGFSFGGGRSSGGGGGRW